MNNLDEYFGDKANLPAWFEYPAGFQILVEQGIVLFAPWYLVKPDFILKAYPRLHDRYGRELVPIAHRHGSDSVACVEKGCGEIVKIINGYTSPGNENEGEFDSFWQWFRFAIEEMIELKS